MTVSTGSPNFVSTPEITIQEGNDSHRMKPIQTEAKSAPGFHPPSSRNASIQPPLVKRETIAVPIPIATKQQDNGLTKSLIKKKNDPVSRSKASLSDTASKMESSIKTDTRSDSIFEVRTLEKETAIQCSAERKKLTDAVPRANVSDTVSVTNLEGKKESTPISTSEDCVSKKLNKSSIGTNEGITPLSNTSHRIFSQPSPDGRGLKTRSAIRGIQQRPESVSNGLKRPVTTVTFKAKKTRSSKQVLVAGRSTSPASCSKHTNPPLTSGNEDVTSNQSEASMAARLLLKRHPIAASSRTYGYEKALSTTSSIPTDLAEATTSLLHNVSLTSTHIQHSSLTMTVPSNQIRPSEISPSPRSHSMTTNAADSAVKTRNVTQPVSSMEVVPHRSSLVTNADRKGLPRSAFDVPRGSTMTTTAAPHRPAMKTRAVKHVSPVKHAFPQASPLLTITPPTKGNVEEKNNENEKLMMRNIPQPFVPEKQKSTTRSCSVKMCSVRQRLLVPSSSVSNIVQSKQADKMSLRTNSQDDSSSIFERHATKFISSKTTNSKPLIPTIRKVTSSARKPAVKKGYADVRSNQKAAMIAARVQHQMKMKPSDVKVKPENTVVSQPRLIHNHPGNSQKCDKQNLDASITQSSPGPKADSCTKRASANHLCMKRCIARKLESPIETSIRKSATAVEREVALTKFSNNSTRPVEPVTENIRPKTPSKGRPKAQASPVIGHHSIANRRTRPMKATDLVKEEAFLTTAGISKANVSTGASTAGKTQPRLPTDLPKAKIQSSTNQCSENRRILSAIEKESTEQANGSASKLRATAAKAEPMLPSSITETNVTNKSTETCEISGSRRVTRDVPSNADQNGADMSANRTGSRHEKPYGVAKKRIENISSGNPDSCSRATGNVTQLPSSSSPGDSSGHPEGLMVVELPYGSIRTITLREEDMERHIPVWNTKLKYKVAGTAAPLGKNIARYLERKKGEFEVYNKQEKYEPEQDRKTARVTIWHKIEKRKISGTSAPLRKNIERYLREHPHCEEYVDQQSKLDATEKKHANARVTVWNKKIGRKQGFGQSGPLRKNLKRYLLRHPHLEEYKGQDKRKSGGGTEEEVQETKVARHGNHHINQDYDGKGQDIVDSGNPEDETPHVNTSEECAPEIPLDFDAKLEPELVDISEELDEAWGFPVCNSEDIPEAQPEVGPLPVDMSNIPDLNAFPFFGESVDFDAFEFDPDSFLPPGHVRELEVVPDPGPDESLPGVKMEIDIQDDVLGDMGDDFIGEVVPEQHMDIEAGINGDSELLPVELEPLDTVDLFPDLDFDGIFRSEDIMVHLD